MAATLRKGQPVQLSGIKICLRPLNKLKKSRCKGSKIKIAYPNSLLRLLAAAVAAFPPPYLLLKSSLTRTKKAIGICCPTDSTATTQYAAKERLMSAF